MNEKITNISQADRSLLQKHDIFLFDSSFIRCKNLDKLREILEANPNGSIVILPETNLSEGSKEYAKAQMLASFPGVVAVVGSTEFFIKRILNNEFGEPQQLSEVNFSEKVVYEHNGRLQSTDIPETSSEEDVNFMTQAENLISESNCWWKANACVFVRDSKAVVSAVSSNPWCTNCKALPINQSEINLRQGERLDFCDAVHAERLAIAKASRTGISLKGSKIYVTSFPCEECSKVLIPAGVETVVFRKDSYGLKDAELLTKNGVNLLRVR